MKQSHLLSIAALVMFSSVWIKPNLLGFNHQSVLASSSYQVQETAVSVNSDDLRDPYLLKISTSSSLSSLSGSISCNGQIIQLLGGRKTQLNLSPYLRPGQNDVVIEGQYSPSTVSVEVELVGRSNQVSQSTSGSGKLDQRILIDVQ